VSLILLRCISLGEGATDAAGADIGDHHKEVGTLDLVVNTDIARPHCVGAVGNEEMVSVRGRRAKEGLVLAKELATTKFFILATVRRKNSTEDPVHVVVVGRSARWTTPRQSRIWKVYANQASVNHLISWIYIQ
jgi:hypothetical protein